MNKKIFNIANLVTLLRIFFALIVSLAVVHDKTNFAVLFFVLAILADKVDGFLARRLDLVSKEGAIFEGCADFLIIGIILFIFLDEMYLISRILLYLSIIFLAITFGLIYFKHKSFEIPHRFSSKILIPLIMLSILLFIVKFRYANEIFIVSMAVGLFYTFPDYIVWVMKRR